MSLTLMASMTGSYRSGKPGNRNTMQWTSSASCSRQLVPELESSLTREATIRGMWGSSCEGRAGLGSAPVSPPKTWDLGQC